MLKVKYQTRDDASEYNIWAEEILNSGETLCGLDTETTVTFKSEMDKDEMKLPSIIQICIRKDTGGFHLEDVELEITDQGVYTCYIFHLKRLWLKTKKIPTNLVKLFKSSNIIKTGAGIVLDARRLSEAYEVQFNSIIDVQDLSKCRGDFDYSLDTLAGKYLRLTKLESKLGNYDDTLTQDQIKYAAYDTYLSLGVCRKMLNLDKLIPLFYHSSKNEVPTKEQVITTRDALDIFNFIKNRLFFNDNAEHPFETLYNTVYNSYNIWPKSQVRSNLTKCLNILAAEGKLSQNPSTRCWSLYIKSLDEFPKYELKDILKSNPDFITKVYTTCGKIITDHGISRSGLLKSLENSLPRFIDNKFSREYIYGQVIDYLIVRKLLSTSNNDKIYIIKDKAST